MRAVFRAVGLLVSLSVLLPAAARASAMMNYAPRSEQLATREEAIRAALKYPEGLNAAKTFVAVNAPFAPVAYRHEDGQVMAAAGLEVRPWLPEHLHAVARDLPAPP